MRHPAIRRLGFIVTLLLLGVSHAAAQDKNPPQGANAPAGASAANAVTGAKTPKIGVANSMYDDIPSVLREINLPFSYTRDSQSPFDDFDVIFVGCALSEMWKFTPESVRDYVGRGGVLYVSDLSYKILAEAFPDDLKGWLAAGRVGQFPCETLDRKLAKSLGKTFTLNFDLASWAYLTQPSAKVNVLLRLQPPLNIPVLFTLTHGRGKVIFTSFHNHANASDLEKTLIQALVEQPVEAARNIKNRLRGGVGARASRQSLSRQRRIRTAARPSLPPRNRPSRPISAR